MIKSVIVWETLLWKHRIDIEQPRSSLSRACKLNQNFNLCNLKREEITTG